MDDAIIFVQMNNDAEESTADFFSYLLFYITQYTPSAVIGIPLPHQK